MATASLGALLDLDMASEPRTHTQLRVAQVRRGRCLCARKLGARARDALEGARAVTGVVVAYVVLAVGLLVMGFVAGWEVCEFRKRVDGAKRLRRILDEYAVAWKPEPEPTKCNHVAIVHQADGFVFAELGELKYQADKPWDVRRVTRGGSA